MNTHTNSKLFLRQCIKHGLAHSFDTKTQTWVKPYPEVTGYLLTFFSKEKKLPKEIIVAGNKLISLQHSSGGFQCSNNKHILFSFDTAQIGHGLLSLYKKTKEKKYLKAAIKAGNFLLSMQNTDGSVFPSYQVQQEFRYAEKRKKDGTNWGNCFTYIQLKNAEFLLPLSKITKNKEYEDSARNMIRWGKKNVDVRFTHPFAYFLEGMIALGEHEYVQKMLEKHIIPRIKKGYISYTPKTPYAYVSGSIQLGILLAKSKHKKEAKKILDWAEKVRAHHNSGGLFQYANARGELDNSIHSEINCWGTKYYLELVQCFK